MNLALIAGLITLGLGLWGLFAPKQAAKLVEISPLGLTGLSEVRATYGGLFVGLGLAALLGDSAVHLALAAAWGTAALARGFSIFLDRASSPKNWGGLALEGGTALLFLGGSL